MLRAELTTWTSRQDRYSVARHWRDGVAIVEKEESILKFFSERGARAFYPIHIYNIQDFVFALEVRRGQRDSTLVSY